MGLVNRNYFNDGSCHGKSLEGPSAQCGSSHDRLTVPPVLFNGCFFSHSREGGNPVKHFGSPIKTFGDDKKNKYLSLMLIGFLFLCGCSQQIPKESNKYREVKEMMGTIVQLDVCQDAHSPQDLENAYQHVWERLEEIAWKMNVFDKKSDVTKVNQSQGEVVSIDKDTYFVLKKAYDFSDISKGAFDITVWPLIKLWKEHGKQNTYPSQEEIKSAQHQTGMSKIEFMGIKENMGQVRVKQNGVQVDLGGIAKGYAIDEAARIFRENGIQNFFIDAGGDLYVGGSNCEGKLWRIGIRDPRNKEKIIDVVKLTNMAVTTSGDYERYYEIQGERFSHIINPITGMPQKDVVSATVIAQDALSADSLSTALAVLGAEKGTALINTFAMDTASIIMVKKSEGKIKKYLSQYYQSFN